MQSLDRIIISNILPSDTAFAVLESDRSQSVFIPPTVARAVKLELGETVEAVVVPNISRPDKTPWCAVRIERAVDDGQIETLRAEIVEDLRENGSATTIELAEKLGRLPQLVRDELRKMATDGVVETATVWVLTEDD